ncbi:MAG: recombinase family protein, partial [Clostridiales bacterium]|nr:recombinase family protein [Clostridiales bacterium]
MDKKKNVAIYYRYNAKLNDDTVSKDFILKSCRDIAEKNNYEIFDIFYDDETTVDDRLQDLIDIIQTQDNDNRLIDGIIVYNYSMLCKSIKHMQQLFNSLENQKLQVFSVEQHIEQEKYNDTLINIIYRLFNEFEDETIEEIDETTIDKKSGTLPLG